VNPRVIVAVEVRIGAVDSSEQGDVPSGSFESNVSQKTTHRCKGAPGMEKLAIKAQKEWSSLTSFGSLSPLSSLPPFAPLRALRACSFFRPFSPASFSGPAIYSKNLHQIYSEKNGSEYVFYKYSSLARLACRNAKRTPSNTPQARWNICVGSPTKNTVGLSLMRRTLRSATGRVELRKESSRLSRLFVSLHLGVR
jgi:hypothetical protein